MAEIKNAKIDSTLLGFEHGILSFELNLSYGEHTAQSFGGWSLGKNYTDLVIKEILKVVGVEKWEDLVDKYIRVRMEEEGGWNARIEAIGNLLNDEWFSPKESFERWKREANDE